MVHMEGASNLLGLDLHLTREKLRDLLRALEEKERLVELLNRVLEQPTGSLEVRVGLEEAHPAMKELAIIGISFQMPSGIWAKIAVLGPMRMRYEKVMGAVLQTRRALESMQFYMISSTCGADDRFMSSAFADHQALKRAARFVNLVNSGRR